MSKHSLLLLFAISLVIVLIAASFQSSPGYMDADYHTYMGRQLATGQGFTEQILWNYLDDPSGLPHPSHTYWPPLPSVLAATGIRLFPSLETFTAARLPFMLLAALVAPLSALLAFQLTAEPKTAVFAGALALLPAYYLPYISTTDSFTPSMVLGALLFLCMLKDPKKANWSRTLALGLIAGLLHLSRAEGIIWLLVALLAVNFGSSDAHSHSAPWKSFALVVGGYVLVMGPWFLRNYLSFGSLLAPGTWRALWLTSYDELFSFPASQLGLQHWLNSGWGSIMLARISALGRNLLGALAVQGHVFLAPLVIAATLAYRKVATVRLAVLAWLILLIAMSWAFPYVGVRGGFFHASATLQPLVWVLAAIGLQRFIDWGARRRGWQPVLARQVFQSAALLFGMLLSIFVFTRRVINWDQEAEQYVELSASLDSLNIPATAIIMVNNPPGFALTSAHPAIVIPNGGLAITQAAAKFLNADYLVLESNYPADLTAVYNSPSDTPGMRYLGTFEGAHLFALDFSSEISP
ncbi:MAG: glycosyltransferase family 39 protein [Chloroflexi bacterium]|nr:glycosyltransferase family 39 protein [Chloroflexota bacterium]